MENDILNELYTIIENEMPDGVLVYRDTTTNLAEEYNFNIIETISTGTDAEYGDYVEYRFESLTGNKAADDGVSLVGKIVLLNSYDSATIFEHTTDAGAGDIVKVANIGSTFLNYDTPSTALITITSSAFVDFTPINLPRNYLSARLSNKAVGIGIGILIKVANDAQKTSINNISTEFLNNINSHNGNFKITIDGKQISVKFVSEVTQEDGGMDKNNIQSRTIYIPLSYMVNYK